MANRSSKIRESFNASTTMKVDRENGLIKGVKLLGEVSRNGRRYSQEAMTQAVSMYEGKVVNLDHKYDGERAVLEGFGRIVNAEMRPDGVYGDLSYLSTHPYAAVICERAEKMPETLGMSHDAKGSLVERNGEWVVSELYEVNSVDLVTSPATTNGLFESEQKPMKRKLREAIAAAQKAKAKGLRVLEMDVEVDPMMQEMEYEMEEMEGDAMPSAEDEVAVAFRAMILAVLDDSSLDVPGKADKIKSLLTMEADAAAVVSGGSSSEEMTEGEGSDEMKDEMKESVRSLQKKVDQLTKLIESKSVAEQIDGLLAEVGATRATLNESQRKLLGKVSTVEDARELIESWDLRESETWPRVVQGSSRAEGSGTYDELRKSSSLKQSTTGYRSA